jgi:hypothetical protein
MATALLSQVLLMRFIARHLAHLLQLIGRDKKKRMREGK